MEQKLGTELGPLCDITLAEAPLLAGFWSYRRERISNEETSILSRISPLSWNSFLFGVLCSSGRLGKSRIDATFYSALMSVVPPTP